MCTRLCETLAKLRACWDAAERAYFTEDLDLPRNILINDATRELFRARDLIAQLDFANMVATKQRIAHMND